MTSPTLFDVTPLPTDVRTVSPEAPRYSHPVHRSHANSLATHRETKVHLGRKAMDVLANVKAMGPGTDREIAARMGFSHKSAVQPRITELRDAGLLAELYTAKDPVTRKPVRVVGVAKGGRE